MKRELVPLYDMDSQAAAPRRRGLTLARLGWVIVTLLTIGLIFASLPARFVQLTQTVDQRPLLQLGGIRSLLCPLYDQSGCARDAGLYPHRRVHLLPPPG